MNKFQTIFFILIFLGFVLRVIYLDKAPIELFGDEIDVGLQAYSIMQTGKDYYGNFMPLMFKSLSEYRLPVFIYSAVPFIKFFGLNEFGVRLTGVFWGILGLVGFFFLSKKIFNVKIALFSLLFLAISPWHLQYSRQAGIESLALLTVVTFSIWFFLKGLNDFKFLFLSSLLFSFSIYIYATAVIFVPLILIALIFIFWKNFKKISLNRKVVLGGIFFLVLIPYLSLYIGGQSKERFTSISVWSDKTLTDEINIRRKTENSTFPSLFHNKPLTYFHEISGNYLKSLSVDFLFFKGDPNLRHSVGGVGEFFLFQLILIMLGIFYLFKQQDKKTIFFILLWLLISPIPSSLTRDGGYHASRLIFLLTPLIILSAVGLWNIYLLKNKLNFRILLFSLTILMFMNLSIYFHRYYIEWPKDSYKFWQFGFKDLNNYLLENENRFNKIYFNNTYEASLPRFLFWQKIDPSLIQIKIKEIKNYKDKENGFDGFKFSEKYSFGTVDSDYKPQGISKLINNSDLYIVSFRDEANLADWRIAGIPDGLELVKTIESPNGEPIFFLITKKNNE